MIAVVIISLTLLGLSGLLIDTHRRTWRDAAALAQREREFARAMYRRRMQASGMIGVIGAGVGIWPIVPRQPGPLAFYTAVLLAACVWIMLLALADFWATRGYYRRLRREQLEKQLQLALELAATREAAEAEGS